jgi:hypothetical protein
VCWFCHSRVPQLLYLLCCLVGAVSQVSWVENAGNVGEHPSNTVGACMLSGVYSQTIHEWAGRTLLSMVVQLAKHWPLPL